MRLHRHGLTQHFAAFEATIKPAGMVLGDHFTVAALLTTLLLGFIYRYPNEPQTKQLTRAIVEKPGGR